ncbi:hypothetical protein [Parapedobacter indicus]|uniref:Uncharacterized protein n=1 Tax=Parapedobacter indicus TaxID=1477437 RepID=A0A1I3E3W3_9SPHI|nr:hypothetical protein [Parapedobacter indicus]PPL04958.1 hypothetical protein CLV26_101769 [Parapedobacter indicus]SFH93680.1 hypothetical protein SAMN05444682_101755 [Parapedobacter indicus]
MIPTQSHPLLVFNGFGYTDFDICRDGLLFIRDVTKGINVINPHGEDPCVYAAGDWQLVSEVSSRGNWIPWGTITRDKHPQERTYIKLADDPVETYIDSDAKEVFSAPRGADIYLFLAGSVAFWSAIILTFMLT